MESTRSAASISEVSSTARSSGSSARASIASRIASTRSPLPGRRYRLRTQNVSVKYPARPGSRLSSAISRSASADHRSASACT